MPRSLKKKKATAVRALLKSLLREKVKNKIDKNQLAKAIGISPSYIDQMLYHGEGGLDAWVSALTYCYNLDEAALVRFFSDSKKALKKMNPISEADKIWFKLSDHLSDNELLLEASLIRERINIETDIAQKKRKIRKPKRK